MNDIEELRSCKKCCRSYPATFEYFVRTGAGNVGHTCKSCKSEYNKAYAKTEHGRAAILSCDARRRETKEYKDYQKAYRKTWRRSEESKRKKLDAYRKRYHSDPKTRLSRVMSSRIRETLREGKGGHKWEEIVGFSLDELRCHIERQFQKGMSWDNMGEWHIDHIVPVASFDFSSHEDADFKFAWALLNLRPMWASENMSKGATRELLL